MLAESEVMDVPFGEGLIALKTSALSELTMSIFAIGMESKPNSTTIPRVDISARRCRFAPMISAGISWIILPNLQTTVSVSKSTL